MSKVGKKLRGAGCARPQGFSVVELVIVVMVILALAALAVPRMLQARMKANEASAIASMKVIREAEELYHNAYPDVGYSGNLADLGSHGSNCESASETNACLIMDNALSSGMKSGYIFELVGDGNKPSRGYTLTATPESAGNSGRCTFFADQDGLLGRNPDGHSRYSTSNSPAGCNPSSF